MALTMTHLGSPLGYKYKAYLERPTSPHRLTPLPKQPQNHTHLIYSTLITPNTTTMPLFSSRRTHATTTSTRRRTGFRNPLRRRDPDRVAGGYKAALANPNTTRTGRKNAKFQLRRMVSFGFNLPHPPIVWTPVFCGCEC